jgi:hypothetical protein
LVPVPVLDALGALRLRLRLRVAARAGGDRERDADTGRERDADTGLLPDLELGTVGAPLRLWLLDREPVWVPVLDRVVDRVVDNVVDRAVEGTGNVVLVGVRDVHGVRGGLPPLPLAATEGEVRWEREGTVAGDWEGLGLGPGLGVGDADADTPTDAVMVTTSPPTAPRQPST